MDRAELPDLNAFIVVAEERSFTRAAVRLETSQSALSHMMRRLEERLGVRLLTRTTRSVSPTDAGERLLERLRPAFDAIAEGLTSLNEMRHKPAGTVRITTSEHAARSIVWPALKPLLADYPDIGIELNINGGFVDIVEQRFDAGVRLGEAIARDMIAVRIGPELRMACVAAPAYFAHRDAPRVPQDLAHHRCINLRMASSGSIYAWEFEQGTRQLNVRVDGALTFNNVPIVLDAARDGLGLCMVMEDAVRDDIAAGRLARVLDDWCPPFAGYHLYYPSRRQPTPAFALVVEALRYRG
ncbi:LysR family transcriptional regulator [Novosphingobium lentum]|uniref:LysR family transcriptional regulator n=1 Tax=Novosphingobium lentum TaxID=145287 RepID=UPI000833D5EF|nr:LysR family transcriptional regulator [Novosphingobium lentum]